MAYQSIGTLHLVAAMGFGRYKRRHIKRSSLATIIVMRVSKAMAIRNTTETWTVLGMSEQDALDVIYYLRAEKRRLLKQPQKKIGDAAEKLNVKRFARTQQQKKANRLKGNRHFHIPKRLLTVRYKAVPLLDDMCPERKKLWKEVTRRPLPLKVPAVKLQAFSFLHDPERTMELLSQIIKVEATQLQATIDFMDAECADIGSYLVFTAMRRYLAQVFTGGNMEPDIQRVIDAVGLRGPLYIGGFSKPTNKDDIWPFHLQQRRPANTSSSSARLLEPQKKEVVADRFVEELDKWLNQVGKQLTLKGSRLVKKMIGEALDNAERHSQLSTNDGDWSLTGYMVRRERGGEVEFKIHLAMLSVGATIAESILGGPTAMIEKMQNYVRSHRSEGLADELLRTVFALQDGVTRDHRAADEARGGTGFQDIFAFFGDLGTSSDRSRAELVIVSGTSCVKVAHPYLLGDKAGPAYSVDQATEREMWFNRSNSPKDPPDGSCVFSLPRRLHGTLITMAIPLDQGFLEAVKANVQH